LILSEQWIKAVSRFSQQVIGFTYKKYQRIIQFECRQEQEIREKKSQYAQTKCICGTGGPLPATINMNAR